MELHEGSLDCVNAQICSVAPPAGALASLRLLVRLQLCKKMSKTLLPRIHCFSSMWMTALEI